MALEGERRGGAESGKGAFEGRDLLIGRPEGAAEDRPAAEASDVPPATPTPQPAEPSPQPAAQPAAHDDAIAEILATVRATASRINAFQEEAGPAHETAEELARETAALTQAVADARGALSKASELSHTTRRCGGDSARTGRGRRRAEDAGRGPGPAYPRHGSAIGGGRPQP